MSSSDRGRALEANVLGYRGIEEARYVAGAPHLRHRSVHRLYEQVADAAIRHVSRDPAKIKVLELGAGSGLASWPWFERGAQVTAVDSSREMLRKLQERGLARSLTVELVVQDALEFSSTCNRLFDVVTHVSMLHHVPDYLKLVRLSASRVAPGGSLITFQDPLRYDKITTLDRIAERASYFAWRLGQGNYRQGLGTRWRRLRGVYSAHEMADFEDYHVVRNGLDAHKIEELLAPCFEEVRSVEYWSTFSSLLQHLGERLRLRSSFGIVALRRHPP
jgi:SAM-dependent methyltransferase